jgi:hypothetical protein
VHVSTILLDFGPNCVNQMHLPICAAPGPSRAQAAAAFVAPCAAAATLVADAGTTGAPQAAETAALRASARTGSLQDQSVTRANAAHLRKFQSQAQQQTQHPQLNGMLSRHGLLAKVWH